MGVMGDRDGQPLCTTLDHNAGWAVGEQAAPTSTIVLSKTMQ